MPICCILNPFLIHLFVRISQEKIEEIRNSTDIVELINSFVPLKKRGKNFVGLCPFHTEKTPSFTVSSEKQMYYCFGCGKGGNAFTFLMEYEKISFTEAVRSLAERVGIAIPSYSSEEMAFVTEQEELYDLCKEVGLFYYKSLTETPEGKFALEYFHHRGFTNETIRKFGLGYSPNSWDALINFVKGRKYSIQLLEKAGLVRKRYDGTYHDYFRGRAMFPIFSTTGRVLGFGARKLYEDDPLGKYINSPETLIYSKSKILYGIYQSKEEIRNKDFAILVEGYIDLISVYQAGIKNVVASSGTALTQEQIQLLKRYTKNVTIMYDADSAGSRAALRGVDLVLENDLDVRVTILPTGEDPDSFVRKNGVSAFQKLLERSVSFIDFIASSYEKERMLSTPEGQAQTVRAIVQTIAKMKDELKRNFYIKQVAEKYQLYETTLYRELDKMIDENKRFHGSQVGEGSEMIQIESKEKVNTTIIDIPAIERDLIHVLLEGNPQIVKLFADAIAPDDLIHPDAKKLYMQIIQNYEEGITIEPSSLIDTIEDPRQRKILAEVALSKYQLSRGWNESGIEVEQAKPIIIAQDVFNMLKRRKLDRMIEENQKKLREASSKGEDIFPYLEQHQKLIEMKKGLDSIKPHV